MLDLADDALRGSYTPLITPFRKGKVDLEAYSRLIEHQIADGGHGVLVNGTSAEPATLTIDERNRLVSFAVETAAGRIPVVAATGSQSLEETITLTRHADALDVAGILVVTPYYTRPPQRGVIAYFESIAATTRRPLMMYHIPGRTAFTAVLDTLQRIADSVPHFVGLKHASTDIGLLTEIRRRMDPRFRLFVGLEDLSFPLLCMGAAGLMNAVGNILPGKLSAMCEAVFRGDLAAGRALHEELWPLNQAVFFDTNPIAVKYMMKKAGLIASNEHRLPMIAATPEVEERLDKILAEFAPNGFGSAEMRRS